MERSARFVVVLLLRHLAAAEFSENRDRLFAVSVEPIDTYTVVGVGIFRDLEHIAWSGVVKLHSQRFRREDVVGDVTAPLSGDVLICRCVSGVCRTDRRQNRNRYKPRVFHRTTLPLLEKSASPLCQAERAAHAGRERSIRRDRAALADEHCRMRCARNTESAC